MTPAWAGPARQVRGVVAEGAVGLGAAGRCRLFRYEVRRWQDGVIGDLDAAVGGPVNQRRPDLCGRLLEVLPHVPRPARGRDELRTGDLWSCSPVTSGALTRSGLDVSAVGPPRLGRAPGLHAGVVAAGRTAIAGASAMSWPATEVADSGSTRLRELGGLRP